jgi:hypothetical protein
MISQSCQSSENSMLGLTRSWAVAVFTAKRGAESCGDVAANLLVQDIAFTHAAGKGFPRCRNGR